MGKSMNLLDRSEFIKASPAIQIQSKITHLQRRVRGTSYSQTLMTNCPTRDIHRVSVADLARKVSVLTASNDSGLSQGNIRRHLSIA